MRLSTAQIFQRGIDEMLRQQNLVSKTQQKLAAGKKILSPSDDPVGAIDASNLKQQLSRIETFDQNALAAKNSLSLSESTLDNINNVLLRVKEILIQAGNETLSDSNRNALSVELQERLNEVLGFANTKNSQGDYIFSGFRTQVQPFTINAAGNVTYNGDQGQRFIDISPSVQIATSDSGYDVFAAIKNGNGSFQTGNNVNNTGTGVINTGSVSDTQSYVEDTYTITFVGLNSNGDRAYSVTGAASGQVLPALPGTIPDDAPAFTSGSNISFNGIDVVITGNPSSGDTFTVSPSSNQNLLTTIQNAITMLESGLSSQQEQTQFKNQLGRSLTNLESGREHLQNIRSKIGARVNTIENIEAFNSKSKLSTAEFLKDIEGLDIAEAASILSQQTFALQAAQQSFIRIQQLSLFNFIS